MLQTPVYLDNNATTPCDPRVLEAMLPYFRQHFGNAASRNHAFGWVAEEAVDLARQQVADLIGAEPREVVFTSGATESDNLALKGVFEAYRSKGNHLITCVTEHKAVLDTCAYLEKRGAEVTYLPVGPDGRINLTELEASFRPTTLLVALMYANNETGVLQPIREAAALARARGVLFFSDATQAVGKIPLRVNEEGIDLMAFSAHKIYGPKGVGALYVRRRDPRVSLVPQLHGGGHERGVRSGTLNVPGIVGLGKACELGAAEMQQEGERLRRLRDQLEEQLLRLEATRRNGHAQHRLPQVANIAFRYAESEALIASLNRHVALSSGSACTSASLDPSHVLKAMGLPDDLARSSLRFGLGRFTTAGEIAYVIEQVTRSVNQLRQASPQWEQYRGGAAGFP